MRSRFVVVSGAIFGFIAVAQLLRAINQVPIHVGGFHIPVWISWVGALAAGGMCAWAFASGK